VQRVGEADVIVKPRRLFIIAALGIVVCCGDGEVTMEPSDTAGVDSETEIPTEESTADTSDSDTAPVFETVGVCGVSGEAIATLDSFQGVEEHYLIGDEGLGSCLCRVRYELFGVGTPDVACDECSWSFIIEKQSPEIVTDVSGTCGSSELGLDADAIAAMDGTRIAYGYAPQDWGHSNVLMRFDEMDQTWGGIAYASWYEDTGELFYDNREGYCGY
jgi:hypothetical protein